MISVKLKMKRLNFELIVFVSGKSCRDKTESGTCSQSALHSNVFIQLFATS